MKQIFYFFTLFIAQTLLAQQYPIAKSVDTTANSLNSQNSYASKVVGWVKQEDMSDDFERNYIDGSKWKRGYLTSWNNKGRTRWTSESKYVTTDKKWGGGVARFGHQWDASNNTVKCGILSSRKEILYPAYIVANIRLGNTALSSNFWLLNQNGQTKEIDVVESYAGDNGRPREAAANYHFFVGSRRTDYFNKRVYSNPSNHKWRNQFHDFAVYWPNPWMVRFYLDGGYAGSDFAELDLFSGRYKLNKNKWNYNEKMRIILDVEEHVNTYKDPIWRYKTGLNGEDRKMAVNYIHTYKYFFPKSADSNNKITELPPGVDPIEGLDTPYKSNEISIYPNPAERGEHVILRGTKKGQILTFTDASGKLINTFTIPHNYDVHITTSNIPSGIYFINVNGNTKKLIIK